MKVDILLAAYNGEKYLAEQIESILIQTYTDWRIIARDDGSTDNTLTLLKSYADIYKDKFLLVESGKQNLGPCQNFALLLNFSDAEYIMFCDQDDIWLPNKIEITIDKMLEMENAHPDRPLLIHTDLNIVDDNLNLISNSMWEYQDLDIRIEKHLYEIAVHNIVTGCTVMINRKARLCSIPIPREALMHDWWIAIIVCKYGIISHIPQSTILYRQHSNNKLGAREKNKKRNVRFYLMQVLRIVSFAKHNYEKFKMLKKLNFKLKATSLIKSEFTIICKNLFLINLE
jgi:glycosyltransferase involved in cell wall biosynthesis